MMLRPMFVTGSLVHGGAERHSITIQNRLADRGHDCYAVYVKNDPSQLERIRRRQGNTVRCLNARWFFDPRALADFARHLERLRPTVLVAANGYALMYASLAKLHARLSIPLVVTYHTTHLFGLKEQLKMCIDRPCFWSADRSIFVCEMQKRYWLRRAVGSRQNEVIYNGVDTDHFSDRFPAEERQALRQSLGFSPTDYVIGISAVLRPEKNHLQLLDAVAQLRNMGIPARLLLIGDGPTRPEIEARCRALQIEAEVVITGFQQDVRPYLAASDVMVLCSLSETFSLAALEAMAMGKPVVHSDVGGVREMIVPETNGYLFPVGDTQTMVLRLAVLADRQLASRMGASARTVVETRFSEKTMVDRYESLLLEVCSERPGAEHANPPLAAMNGFQATAIQPAKRSERP